MSKNRQVYNWCEMRKQRSRKQILNAAIIEFEKSGVDKASMESLAKAAGLTRATIYNLFDSKESIAEIIVQQQVEKWSEKFLGRVEAGDDGVQILADALITNAETSMKYPNIAYSVMSKPQTSSLPDGDEKKSFRYLVRSILALCQQQNSLRKDLTPTYLMFIVLGVYTQLMIFSITSKTAVSPLQIEQMLQTLIVGIGGSSKT